MNEGVTFRSMMKNHQFMKSFIAGLISRFGDSVDMIAYSYMVYELTGSAVLMATLFAVNGIPSLVVNLFSGVLVTYMPKKRVVWTCDFLRGTVVTLTGILYFLGMLQVWHLYVFTLLNSTFEAFRSPANMVLFRMILTDEEVEHATSLSTSARTIAELVGYSIAGLLIGTIGVHGAIILDGVTFFIAGGLISALVYPKESLTKMPLELKHFVKDLGEGIRYIRSNTLIMTIALFAGGLMFLLSPFNALQTPYILDNMDLGANGIAVLSVGFMLAMIIGSLMIPYLSKTIGIRKLFIIGGIILGIGYLIFGFIEVFAGGLSGYVAVGVASIVMGSTASFLSVPAQIGMMRFVDKEFLPRVSSAVSVMAMSSVPLGGAIVAALVTFVEIRTMFMVTGVGVILLYMSQWSNDAWKAFDEDKPETIGP